MAERQTVAGAYQKIESHEELCAERYRVINLALEEMRSGQKWLVRTAVSILLALIGWMAVQMWGAQSARVERLERPSASAPAR